MSAESYTAEAQRRERATQAEQAIRFRSILARTADDQREAIHRGYSSVTELAIDELGRAYHELLERIEDLEHAVADYRERFGVLR